MASLGEGNGGGKPAQHLKPLADMEGLARLNRLVLDYSINIVSSLFAGSENSMEKLEEAVSVIFNWFQTMYSIQ